MVWIALSLLTNLSFGIWSWSYGPKTGSPTPTHEIEAHVIYCHDGDTCTLQGNAPNSPRFKLRLAGIDAPEVDWGKKRGQIYGDEAKRKVENWVLGKKLHVRIVGTDRYGRYLGRMSTDGFEVNMRLVEEGYAYAYRSSEKNARENQSYVDAENRAQKKRSGFWALAVRPEEPWRHRHPD